MAPEPHIDIGRYLARIGYDGPITVDLATLQALQRAHMTAVPFENLHVYHQVGVRTGLDWSIPKVVDRGRGGWCFELNGAFGALLTAIGFEVRHIGAAVLLDGPKTKIDHLALEVMLDEPWLVDVGFGESFILPLALNRRGPQDGGDATYELLPSPQGTTLTRLDDDGTPAAQYRFKRVALTLSAFDAASEHMQSAPDLHWRHKPFATRLLGSGADRVTLLKDRLKITHQGEPTETPVAAEAWETTLIEYFGYRLPTVDNP